MSNRKLDFPGLYMKATYDCAQLKVQCDDLTEEISRLRDENETLRRDVKTAVMGDSAELQDVKRENEKLRAALKPFAETGEQIEEYIKLTGVSDGQCNDTKFTFAVLRAAAAAIRESGDE